MVRRILQREVLMAEKYLCLADQGGSPPPAIAGRARMYYGAGLSSRYIYSAAIDVNTGQPIITRMNDPRRGPYGQLVMSTFETFAVAALVASNAGQVLGQGFVDKVGVVLTDQFVGAGISSLTLRVYNTESGVNYISGFNLLQPTLTPIVETTLPVNEYINTSYQIVAEVTAVGADLDQLTAGAFKVFATTLEEASLGNYTIS